MHGILSIFRCMAVVEAPGETMRSMVRRGHESPTLLSEVLAEEVEELPDELEVLPDEVELLLSSEVELLSSEELLSLFFLLFFAFFLPMASHLKNIEEMISALNLNTSEFEF